MAYKIIVKRRFTNKAQKVLAYLEREWSRKVAADFLVKIDRRMDMLSKQPYVGAPSTVIKDVRGVLITRHNKIYYKIKGKTVTILNMYDTRMKPGRNRYK